MPKSNPEQQPQIPGPGAWQLDATHFDRPITRYMQELLPAAFAAGQSSWMRRYGVPMKTVAAELIDGFLYIQPIPLVGAPGANPPPTLLFKLAFRLLPALRRCSRLAERAVQERRWREDARRWREEIWPGLEQKFRDLQEVAPGDLDDAALLAHLRQATDVMVESMEAHYATGGSIMVPAGIFIAEVTSWAEVDPGACVEAIGGAGENGEGALLDALALALREDGGPDALGELAPAELLDALRARQDAVGAAARAWLDVAGPRQIWAGDLHLPTGDEVPQLLLEQLRTHTPAQGAADRPDPAAALRARVPAGRRARFDALLAEARSTAFIRDQRSSKNDAWSCGLVRRALLEVGRRLAARGLVDEPGHAVHLRRAEVESLLLRGEGPDRGTIRAHAGAQQRSIESMPPFVGQRPPPPPPFAAVGGALGEVARGILAYVALMEDLDAPGEASGARLRGYAASAGEYTGVARLVKGPDDFHRLRRGDVLVTRATMPSYNGALAVAGAVITDRGGALSHAAIVSRELGIPAVVGTMKATQIIAEGARVRVDGTSGEVEVLA